MEVIGKVLEGEMVARDSRVSKPESRVISEGLALRARAFGIELDEGN